MVESVKGSSGDLAVSWKKKIHFLLVHFHDTFSITLLYHVARMQLQHLAWSLKFHCHLLLINRQRSGEQFCKEEWYTSVESRKCRGRPTKFDHLGREEDRFRARSLSRCLLYCPVAVAQGCCAQLQHGAWWLQADYYLLLTKPSGREFAARARTIGAL